MGRGWRGVASLVISGAPLFLLTDHTNKLLPLLVVPVEIMLAASISWTIVSALVALMGCPERSHESP